MSRINKLLRAFERFVSLPWELNLAGSQRVWLVVYDKTDERRLRAGLTEFELASKQAGHPWLLIDLTNDFAEWMAGQEYRESYFEDPSALELLMPEFEASMIERISRVLSSPKTTENTVVALSGIACLFGFIKVSSLIQALAPHIRGRLLVFFPGEHENNNYRLLDARDGWSYMAVPITVQD